MVVKGAGCGTVNRLYTCVGVDDGGGRCYESFDPDSGILYSLNRVRMPHTDINDGSTLAGRDTAAASSPTSSSSAVTVAWVLASAGPEDGSPRHVGAPPPRARVYYAASASAPLVGPASSAADAAGAGERGARTPPEHGWVARQDGLWPPPQIRMIELCPGKTAKQEAAASAAAIAAQTAATQMAAADVGGG